MSTDRQPWIDRILDEVRRALAGRAGRPHATYRIQFHKECFRFAEAAATVPYLARLGVSHVYCSPYMKTRSDAEHGYAVVDYNQLDPALGTEDDYRRFVAALKEHGLEQIFDIVPNHMSVEPSENLWWRDVLENGPASPHAKYFDIEWHPVNEELRDRVQIPVLGDRYGEVLEGGQIRVEFRAGALEVVIYDAIRLPVDPSTYPMALGRHLDELRDALADSPELRELESIVTAIRNLPDRHQTTPEAIAERQREKEVIKDRLGTLAASSSAVAAHIQRNLTELNGTPQEPRSFDELEQFIESQVYRLSHWRAAGDEINYRRFFDVNELAAVSMENEQVFEDSHQMIFDLLARGDVAGLRVDHVDGLFDPAEYLWRLQRGYVRALARQAHDRMTAETPPPAEGQPELPQWEEIETDVLQGMGWIGQAAALARWCQDTAPDRSVLDRPIKAKELPLYLLVEKILGPHEPLPPGWPIHGTTGYDFTKSMGELFVDPAGLRDVLRIYNRFTGVTPDFHEMTYEAKLLIVRVSMASELQLLAYRLTRLAKRFRWSRDFTLNALRDALRRVLASFPVYRTYIGCGYVSERDRRFVHQAVAQAKRRAAAIDPAVFNYLRDVLLLERPLALDEADAHERDTFVGRFQQVTSPVMAKGVEDTTFYRYFPLASLAEVGGEPSATPTTLEAFHRENQARLAHWPLSMLSTTTHDSKRSEDVRARISVLSETPELWRAALNRWSRFNRRYRAEAEGEPIPSRNDEYLLYQMLVGVWPIDPPDAEQREQLIVRVQQYMEKATHEAKVRTSWIHPDPDYDAGVHEFIAGILREGPKNRFLADFQEFHERILDAGLYTALSQVFLKLVSPGVPDIYQGQELWDFSMVDPDNRRPVDYQSRQWLLGELETQDAEAATALASQLGRTPRDSRLKLLVTWRLLQCRRENPALFEKAEYEPLAAEGPRAEHVCAFLRRLPARGEQPELVAVAVAPRLLGGLVLTEQGPRVPLGEEIWRDTRLRLPPGSYRDIFSQGLREVGAEGLTLGDILADFPVAFLVQA